MRIAHISDIHVSSDNYVPEWGDNVIRTMNQPDMDLVILTGDLTMNGHPHEYDKAKEFMDRIDPRCLVVPGNHDSYNGGYVLFEELFGTRKPHFENDIVVVQGMDSSEPDLDDGKIGRHNYPLIERALSKDKVRILALHHHIIPVPMTGREWNILSDAGDVLAVCIDLKLDLVLSGHRHLPWIWNLQGTHFVTAGTACTRRLKGRTYPSFNIIEMDGDRLILERVNVRTGERTRLIDRLGGPTGRAEDRGQQ
ncbi:MAG: metallophosphoesterase family protein [Thermoplasmatota archaeon]